MQMIILIIVATLVVFIIYFFFGKRKAEQKTPDNIKSFIRNEVDQDDNTLTISVDVKGIMKEYGLKNNIPEEEIDKAINNMEWSSPPPYVAKEMIHTPAIEALISDYSSVSRDDNALLREGYKTRMYSKDYSFFIKDRICNNDIESIWQFLCLSKEYEYDETPHTYHGFQEGLISRRMIKLLNLSPDKYYFHDIIYAYKEKQPVALYKKIENIYQNKLNDIERKMFKDAVHALPIADRILLEQIINLDFKSSISISENCWSEILSTFILYVPINYTSVERGRLFLTTEIIDVLSYSLSIYDFKVINILPLAELANYLIQTEAKELDYFKDIPLFNLGDFLKEYNAPVISEDLKMQLELLGINERYYFLHDCFPSGNILPYYKTKANGIDENTVNKRLIDNNLLVPYTDYSCLLEQSKDTLLSIAEQCNITVRKSWKKDKVYETIVQEGKELTLLHEIIRKFDRYQINPKYQYDIEELIKYQNTIRPLIQLLSFI